MEQYDTTPYHILYMKICHYQILSVLYIKSE